MTRRWRWIFRIAAAVLVPAAFLVFPELGLGLAGVFVPPEVLVPAERHGVTGVPGNGLFWEHVHLFPSGNELVARILFPAVVSRLPNLGSPVGALRSPDELLRLALTSYDRQRMAWEILDRVSKPPFVDQIGHQERVAQLQALVDAPLEPEAQVRATYLAALRERAEPLAPPLLCAHPLEARARG